MDRFKFAPAQSGDLIYGAQRPGYSAHRVGKQEVDDWIEFMKGRGIRRVCCLLAASQLDYYDPALLKQYYQAFGSARVLSAPVEDYHLCDQATLDTKILPFLVAADEASEPTVVHCSGGSGRTVQILAAWLVRKHGLSVKAAIDTVRNTDRNSLEAVGLHATEADLYALLENPVDASDEPGKLRADPLGCADER